MRNTLIRHTALVLAAALGVLVGRLLVFTAPQTVTVALSCCLFVSWLMGQMDSDAFDLLNSTVVAIPLTAVVFGLAWLSFSGHGAEYHSMFRTRGNAPRFISLIIATIPAVPYGVAALFGWMFR